MPTDAWTFDELAHAGGEHLDPAYVAAYDRKAAVDPANDLALLRSQGLSAEDTLVDLGAGTGTFALAAAPFCKRIVAVDVSPTMLAALRTKAERMGITNIDYASAGFLRYQHVGDSADAVYSRNALHHLPDFWKALALQRIASILRPGGLLLLRDLVFSFEPDQAHTAIAAWLAGAASAPEEGWTRDELETHLRQEYSTFTWLLEPMLRHAGFQIRQVEASPSGIYAAYLCARDTTA
ncbi:MAG TPA: class I SAM-dependent methyltransferase [Ktedonobacterales bacterium]|jgi:ubiquinone/menaquinone biosynthesis C-methylase UbiE|nr:class I SAM-dependent methyltransferase [Ktedonobacterales bacterium]